MQKGLIWENSQDYRIRGGKIEHYCEACEKWKTGLFYKTQAANYWRCEACKNAGKLRKQTNLFDVE